MANKLETLVKAREPIAQGQGYFVGQLLPIDHIRTDGGTQARAGLDESTVAEYAESWSELSRKANGFNEMPPIVVYHDGTDHWLADGFHRLAAYKRFLDSGSASAAPRAIRAIIHAGQRRDAVLAACGANATHGLRRTNADKRRAIETLLRDEEWRQWSDSEIARRVIVDHKTVAAVRAQLYPGNSQDSRTVERAGTTYQQRTPQPATAPANDDERHIVQAQRILAKLDQWAESERPRQIQDAYQHAHQVRDLTLRSRLFREIDRAVDAEAEAEEAAPIEIPASLDIDQDLITQLGDAGWRWISSQRQADGQFLHTVMLADTDVTQRLSVAGLRNLLAIKPDAPELAASLVVGQRTEPQQADPVAPPVTMPEPPSPDELASVQARWAALGWQLLPDLAVPTNNRYRLVPPKGQLGIVNVQWHDVLERLAIQEQKASPAPAQPTDPRTALEARGWEFLPATSPSGWIRLEHPNLGYVRNEPTIGMALKAAAELQAGYDRADRLRDRRGTVADANPVARWFGETHTRIVATVEMITWCNEQRAQLDSEERELLAEDARQLIAELEKLVEALKGA